MRIGFDAKRAYFNRSGLGNYSRGVIQLMTEFQPTNNYFLYTPSGHDEITFPVYGKVKKITPGTVFAKKMSSLWRTYLLAGQLKKDKIDVYHGLSNELPGRLRNTKMGKVVTIHDLIFFRYPEYYKSIDRQIYARKTLYSCNIADKVIAVSEQTKRDVVEFLEIAPEKIEVVYQGCNPLYYPRLTEEIKKPIRDKYDLPSSFVLYVGTIEARKNLLNVVKAMHTGGIDMPLLVVGKPTPYLETVKQYIHEKKMEHVYLLHGVPLEDLPAIYQMATVFVYPSMFEGFGIPILEALNSGVPVITSKGSCFSEAGGKAALYTDPESVGELTEAIRMVIGDSELRKKMITEGHQHTLKFRENIISGRLMKIYKEVMK
ncbi:MAG TPA: glycosyltransferase family 1 protein [Bacteroidales bacterium]|nr:glycosyltransferase family 1 protein [Bacteroidales bacterium]